MIKYISKSNKADIRYFEDDANVEEFIDLSEYRLMTDAEIDCHENPLNSLSDEEKLLVYRQNMPTLTPIEFDIKLVDSGLYDKVQSLVQSDIKLRIAYTRATFFSRTDTFVDQARVALGLTDEQVDSMWVGEVIE